MRFSIPLFAASAASCALALPALVQPRAGSPSSLGATAWNEGAVNEYVIHSSCNDSETIQLRKGLADAVTLADHAVQHILRWGNSSEHYRKYFGNAPSGEAIGYYEKVINGDKGNALFRCDNPDGNCDQPEWGGHWRGENATNETVICPLSYATRRPLEQLCALGYTVAEGETNIYFGSDLLHRLYHMPAFSDSHVDHFAEDYAEVLELAKTNETYATHDSDTLQYFALDVYAFDIVVPGIGCPGTLAEATNSSMSTTAPTPYQSPPTSVAGTPTSTTTGAPDSVTDAPQACHTHADGQVHCD